MLRYPGNDEVVICSAVRTPFSKFGGSLRGYSSIDLAAVVLKAVVDRAPLAAHQIDEVVLGMARVGEAALSNGIIARQAILKAGFPDETVSMTVDRACCSSITTTQIASYRLLLGESSVVVSAGVDNMGREPFLLSPELRWGNKIGPVKADDTLFELGYRGYAPVAVDSGRVALEHGVSREEQDDWALRSQMRYQQALSEGKFSEEIVPIKAPDSAGEKIVLDRDEFPKPHTTKEKLQSLPTVYGSATVTAGNAPGLDTGACALLLATRFSAEKLGLTPMATVVATSSVAVDADKLPIGPAKAIEKVCAKAGLTLKDINLIEINEAFAAVPLVSLKILSGGDPSTYRRLLDKTNVNGGAIAIGHPVGASAGRITMALARELRMRKGGYGVAAICGGLGQADAILLRVGS